MLDLFGQEVAVYKGQPMDIVTFTDDEVETVIEDVVYSGMLIEQMAANLKKVRHIEKSTDVNEVRRSAWVDLMWCYDLWDSPSRLSFDDACAFVQADAEQIRSAISTEFAGEIRLMVAVIVATYPDELKRLQQRLRPYISVAIH